jgi:hypothetical protein
MIVPNLGTIAENFGVGKKFLQFFLIWTGSSPTRLSSYSPGRARKVNYYQFSSGREPAISHSWSDIRAAFSLMVHP